MSALDIKNKEKYLVKIREYLTQVMDYLNKNQLKVLSENVLKILAGKSKTKSDLETKINLLHHFKNEFESSLRSYERLPPDEARNFRQVVNTYSTLKSHVFSLYQKVKNDIKQMETQKGTETPIYNSTKKFLNMLNWWFIFVKRFLGNDKNSENQKPSFHPTVADRMTFNHISKIITQRMKTLAKSTPQTLQPQRRMLAHFRGGAGTVPGQGTPLITLPMMNPGGTPTGLAGNPLSPPGVVTPQGVLFSMVPGLLPFPTSGSSPMLINLGQPPPPPQNGSRSIVNGRRVGKITQNTNKNNHTLVGGKGVTIQNLNNSLRKMNLTKKQQQQLRQRGGMVVPLRRVPPPPRNHNFIPPPPPPQNNNVNGIKSNVISRKVVDPKSGGGGAGHRIPHPVYSFPSIGSARNTPSSNNTPQSSSSSINPLLIGSSMKSGVKGRNTPRILIPVHSSTFMKGNVSTSSSNNNNNNSSSTNSAGKFPINSNRGNLSSRMGGRNVNSNNNNNNNNSNNNNNNNITTKLQSKYLPPPPPPRPSSLVKKNISVNKKNMNNKNNNKNVKSKSSTTTKSSTDHQQQQQQQSRHRKIGFMETNKIFQTAVQRLRFLQDYPDGEEVGRHFRSIQNILGNDEDILFIGRKRRNIKPSSKKDVKFKRRGLRRRTRGVMNQESKEGRSSSGNNDEDDDDDDDDVVEIISPIKIKKTSGEKQKIHATRGKKFDDQSYVPPIGLSPEKIPVNLNLKLDNKKERVGDRIEGSRVEDNNDNTTTTATTSNNNNSNNNTGRFDVDLEVSGKGNHHVENIKTEGVKVEDFKDDEKEKISSQKKRGQGFKKNVTGSKRGRPKGFLKETFMSFSSVIRPPLMNWVKKRRKLNDNRVDVKSMSSSSSSSSQKQPATDQAVSKPPNSVVPRPPPKPGLPTSPSLGVGWDGRRIPERDEPEEVFPTLNFIDDEMIKRKKKKESSDRNNDNTSFEDDEFLFDESFDDENSVMVASSQIKKSLKFVKNRFEYDINSKEAVLLKVNRTEVLDDNRMTDEDDDFELETRKQNYVFSTKPTLEQNLLNNHIQCYRVIKENHQPNFIIRSSGDVEEDWRRCNEVEWMLIHIETTLYSMEIFEKGDCQCQFVLEIEVSQPMNEFHVICRFSKPNVPNFRVSTKDRTFRCSGLDWMSSRSDEEFNYLYKLCKKQFFDQIDEDWKKKKLGVDLFFALKCWIESVRRNCKDSTRN